MSANFLLPLICIRLLQGTGKNGMGEVEGGRWGRGKGGGGEGEGERGRKEDVMRVCTKKWNDIRQCGCFGSVPFNVSCKYLARCTCQFRWSSLHHINPTPGPHYCPLCCQDRSLFLPLSPSVCLSLSVSLSVSLSHTNGAL